MKYSETGQFTLEMKRLAKQISKSISKLRSLGCVVLGKECFLTAYMAEDYRHSHEHSSDYELKSLECGRIDDSGADDEEYFEDGYITEI